MEPTADISYTDYYFFFFLSILSYLNLDMWGFILKLMLHTAGQTKFKSFGNNSDDKNSTRIAILES